MFAASLSEIGILVVNKQSPLPPNTTPELFVESYIKIPIISQIVAQTEAAKREICEQTSPVAFRRHKKQFQLFKTLRLANVIVNWRR